jgi:hypothetical protein
VIHRPSAVRVLLALLAAAVVAGSAGRDALAAPWCGTTTTQDRAPSLTGRSIRIVYAYAADAPDRSGEVASRISADVDAIDDWWRAQDPTREPRFDRASFACGPQADILALRLSDSAAELRRGAGRGGRIAGAVAVATGRSPFEKQLVYYDGPVDDPDTCGEGEGRADGDGVAIVYLGACTDVPSAVVAGHELLHALGALAEAGPPHACPDTRGHPCDSNLDLLYPFASSGAQLGSLFLDVGHDDYYAHSGSWPDLQDSLWLRLLAQQLQLSLAIAGRGSVESDVPGIDCAASCTTDWDAGSRLSLEPLPRAGQRFVRWSGACSGSGPCNVTLEAAQSVGALFAPERFPVAVTVSGRGRVTGAGAPCVSGRCSRSAPSYAPLRLQATPGAGWRLAGWSGGCTGRAPSCTLPMTKASAVRARFVRR